MSDLLTRERTSSQANPPTRDGPVLVVDFGAQYAQLIARRVREAGVYSEIVPHTSTIDDILDLNPSAIILSGGPSSVYQPGAPAVDPKLFRSGIPTLGICYGFQAMASALGGVVERNDVAEYGRTKVGLTAKSSLLLGHNIGTRMVWMSHRDAVLEPPPGFSVSASSAEVAVAAFEDDKRKLYGVQWHPEVMHTEDGQDLLKRFLFDGAGVSVNWTTDGIIEEAIDSIADQVGQNHVICGLSGGVDSAVAAALVQRAVGSQLTCVFINHGLLRKGEVEQVELDFVKATGVELVTVHAEDRFMDALAGKVDPEEKRKAIGAQFIREFEAAAESIVKEHSHEGDIEYLVQGTLYPDVVESGGGTDASVIKSHHNVGGLPDDLRFQLVEPLRTLFKDEVRQVGEQLGLPGEIIWRHPFPGPGLAIRIVGEVTADRVALLREADAIATRELAEAGLTRSVWQFPVVLLADVRSVGIQGDSRSYGHPVVLRPVSSEDAMTADWSRLPYEVIERISTRITNEVPEINRVTLDVTSKPPASIEWE